MNELPFHLIYHPAHPHFESYDFEIIESYLNPLIESHFDSSGFSYYDDFRIGNLCSILPPDPLKSMIGIRATVTVSNADEQNLADCLKTMVDLSDRLNCLVFICDRIITIGDIKDEVFHNKILKWKSRHFKLFDVEKAVLNCQLPFFIFDPGHIEASIRSFFSDSVADPDDISETLSRLLEIVKIEPRKKSNTKKVWEESDDIYLLSDENSRYEEQFISSLTVDDLREFALFYAEATSIPHFPLLNRKNFTLLFEVWKNFKSSGIRLFTEMQYYNDICGAKPETSVFYTALFEFLKGIRPDQIRSFLSFVAKSIVIPEIYFLAGNQLFYFFDIWRKLNIEKVNSSVASAGSGEEVSLLEKYFISLSDDIQDGWTQNPEEVEKQFRKLVNGFHQFTVADYRFISEIPGEKLADVESIVKLVSDYLSPEDLLSVGLTRIFKLASFSISNTHAGIPDSVGFAQKMKSFPSAMPPGEKLINVFLVRFRLPEVFIRNFFILGKKDIALLNHLLDGKNIREADGLPFTLSKKTAHLFSMQTEAAIDSRSYPASKRIDSVMLYCTLQAAGANSKLAYTLSGFTVILDHIRDDFDFWNEVFLFFIQNCPEKSNLDFFERIPPLIDYIIFRRYGGEERSYSIRGRTLESLTRAMQDWHQALRAPKPDNEILKLKWPGTDIENFKFETNKCIYKITQLKSALELFEEGQSMNHCVFSYTVKARGGNISIWSARKRILTESDEKRMVTIELDNSTKEILQIRGKHNRMPDSEEKWLIEKWRSKENISVEF